jgi:LysR family nitrogen assimilation transcriptional regulator
VSAAAFPVRDGLTALQSEARERALGLRDLRCFLHVAETGNVGRAARELNVSQPAVSLQLRKLEQGLGTQLLLRHGRGVTLTPAGACLRDRLDTILRLLGSPLEDGAPEPLPDVLSFAVPVEIGAILVAPLARAVRERWPDVMLDVREGSGAEVEEWLLHRQVDLAMLPDTPSLPEIETTPIFSECLGLVAPAHARIGAGAISLRELAREPLILPRRRHWIRRRLDWAAQQYGVSLTSVLQADSIALSKAMVRNGLGCAVLPQSAVQDEIAKGAVVFRPIGQPSLTCTHVIAFHRAASNSAVAALGAMACEALTDLIERGNWQHAQVMRRDVSSVRVPPAQTSGLSAEEVAIA